MVWTRLRLCCPSGPSASAGARQPLRFDGAAFRLQGTAELARAWLVLRLCAWPPVVAHGLAVSGRARGWRGLAGAGLEPGAERRSLPPSSRPGRRDCWAPGCRARFCEHPCTGSSWPGRRPRRWGAASASCGPWGCGPCWRCPPRRSQGPRPRAGEREGRSRAGGLRAGGAQAGRLTSLAAQRGLVRGQPRRHAALPGAVPSPRGRRWPSQGQPHAAQDDGAGQHSALRKWQEGRGGGPRPTRPPPCQPPPRFRRIYRLGSRGQRVPRS